MGAGSKLPAAAAAAEVLDDAMRRRPGEADGLGPPRPAESRPDDPDDLTEEP
jgi:hypothetical protein